MLSDPNLIKIKEDNLPYFVLGTFENNHRRSDNLISTQFISIDFDDLDGRADELDEKLKVDENYCQNIAEGKCMLYIPIKHIIKKKRL